jgi:hypothetical protein
MTYCLLALFVSAGIIVLVSEVAKANATLGALIKSLPLVSVLAIFWLRRHDLRCPAALLNREPDVEGLLSRQLN